MTPERWQQVNQLFHSALKYDPSQRASFLNQACDGDQELRQEVESLISSRNSTGGILVGIEKRGRCFGRRFSASVLLVFGIGLLIDVQAQTSTVGSISGTV